MAAAISSVSAPRRARKFRPATPLTPRRRLLGAWSKLFRRARSLRARLPELSGGKALDAAVDEWLTEGEALAVVMAATSTD